MVFREQQTLSGNCVSTSFFIRRSKNGRKTLCRRRMINIVSSWFNSTCKDTKISITPGWTEPTPQIYLLSSCSKWSVEPLLETSTTLEDAGQKKVQQSPQLREFILKTPCD